VVLNGKTTLRQLMALLKKCDLLVTNDSGPMHVAMGLKVPVVAIFGSTDPKTTGPFGRAGIVVKREVVCSPCQLRVCPIDHRCMEWVTVGEVFTAAAKCLEETGFPRWKTSVKNESSVGAKGKQVTEVAVFLDRDGTLNKDVGYVDRRERMAFYPRSIAAIQLLNQAGIKVLLVTNQAGVARGIMTEAAVQTLHRELVRLLKRKGAFLDGIYYCPHHPEAGNSPYTQVCQCRKPAPGLIEKASQEHGIDLRRSYVVGDKWSDMELARRVGARGILVLTGDGNQEVHRCIRNGSKAEVVVPDLYEAVQWILRDFSAGGQRDINPTKVTELNLKI
jgi:heptosyltransferase-2